MPFRVPPQIVRPFKTPAFRRRLLIGAAALFTFGIAVLLAAWMRVCAGNSCPSIEGLEQYDPDQASKVYAADGRLITDLGLQRRTVVPLEEISPAVIAAFVVTEDKRFYQHDGIDWIRVLGAVKDFIVERGIAGGASTITMQLAGNLWPEDINRRKITVSRKLREMRVAREIEERYSKDKILELYLNQIDLGNRAFGVEAAAQRYFGKSARDLNVAEAAMLAALPKAPSRYNPRRNPDRAVLRRNVVINLLRDNGLLAPEEAQRWKAYPLLLSSRNDYSSLAEYFVEYVRQELDRRFGDDLYTEGLQIYTTLDLDMQQTAERVLEAQLQRIESEAYGRFPHVTYREYLDSVSTLGEVTDRNQTPYLQGLLVAMEAKTGYIRAMVGGRDFDDSKFNRATQALRQPGSTFKPFVYSAALRAGYPLSHVIVDEPLVVEIPEQPLWTPQNYDLEFDGPATLRENLYRSRNIPAIKLGLELGPDAVVSEAMRYGISTRVPRVPSIYIGAADVIPLDMVAAYTAFANLGTRSVPTAIVRVEDRNGNILWEPRVQTEPVMSPEQAWLITDVLRDVVQRGTAWSTVGRQIDFPAGGKTGTTNEYNDVWFIGFTPDLVAGIWMGFDQPQRIKDNAQGGLLAAPAWTAFMKEVYERRRPPEPWPRPETLTFAEVDKRTGYKATPFCPREVHYIESFIAGTEPGAFCPVHSPFGGMVGQTSSGADTVRLGSDTATVLPDGVSSEVTPATGALPPGIGAPMRGTTPPATPGAVPAPSGQPAAPAPRPPADTTRP